MVSIVLYIKGGDFMKKYLFSKLAMTVFTLLLASLFIFGLFNFDLFPLKAWGLSVFIPTPDFMSMTTTSSEYTPLTNIILTNTGIFSFPSGVKNTPTATIPTQILYISATNPFSICTS